MEEAISIPEELRQLPRAVLERYVFERIRQFSRVFAQALNAPSHTAEAAFEQSWAQLSAVSQTSATFSLKFAHHCRFLACTNKACALCVNNPDKRCAASDNFDEAYADNQTLKAKCKAEVFVQAFLDEPGSGAELPSGLQVQLFVVDGECCADDAPRAPDSFRELLKSDEGVALLSSSQPADPSGLVMGTLQGDMYRLPDLSITDKTDTFRMEGQTFSSFRLVARAVQVDMRGQMVVMQNVAPAISSKFVIKTQRALNDFSKPSYPHHKDRLTRLKYIGGVTADRLRDIQTHMPGVPFSSIETVEQLRQLMLYTDQNRQIEGKLLDVLSMKGRHKHKWDYLKEVLTERIVYDDMLHRVWYADQQQSQGVLFTCKQGLVIMDKPYGLVERVAFDNQARLRVMPARDADSNDLMRRWRDMAVEAWLTSGHPGWAIATEPMELADGHSLQQTPGSSSQQLMDSMEGLQMTAGMGDSSNPHTPPWQSTPERRSLTSRGMSGPSAFGLLSQTSNSPSHSPHCRSAAGPDATGAFAFTAQRAIGELKSRLSGGLGSGSFGPGQLEGLAGRLSSGEATPQGSGLPGAFVLGSNGSPLTHTGPTNSPRMVRVHGARSPASGSPVASPRSGSPMLDRSQLAPRPASFSHQRGRQVSSSAECTPHKPAQHKPLLSVFARGRDGSSPAGAGASGQSPHHQRATQDFGQQDFGQQDFGQQQAAFQSSTNQGPGSAKRRRASLPDYSGNMFADATQLQAQGSHGPPASSYSPPESAMDAAPLQPGRQYHSSMQDSQYQGSMQDSMQGSQYQGSQRQGSHYQGSMQDSMPGSQYQGSQRHGNQYQSGRAPYGPDFGGVMSPEAAQALTPEQQAMLMHMDRFSDGMVQQQQQQQQQSSLDSPHLLASIEQCLHLSDQGMRSLPPGVRTSGFGEVQQRSSVPTHRAARALDLTPAMQPPEHGQHYAGASLQASAHAEAFAALGPRASYATSATAPSAASRHSQQLQRGVNLASADPSYDGPGAIFSPSTTSDPSAGSGQSAGLHHASHNLAAPGPAYSPGGHEAASAFVSEASAPPGGTAGRYDEDQVDRWFDQAHATHMDRDRTEPDSHQAVVVDKSLSKMMERSGSFGRLLDSMLASAKSCELTPETLGLS